MSGSEQSPQPDAPNAGPPAPKARRNRPGSWLASLGALVLVGGPAGYGVHQHYEQHRMVMAAAEQHRDFVPALRVDQVHASGATRSVTLPGTTLAYASATIFARASGYIDKRYVDIGSRVKAGELLAEITAPELDHQIALAEADLAQTQAALGQAHANQELANVTNKRTAKLTQEGWVTKEQGDTDRLNFQAQNQAVRVAQANIDAQQAQLMVLRQQKAYQKVVAPFDGVVTQRNIDIGNLVQADNTGGTPMFSLEKSDIIRVQVFVPQDSAFGLSPGVAAVIRVPEIPDRTFKGSVTRIADALDPQTRTLLTEIEVPNPDGALTPGVYCSVELQIPRKTPSLIVSADAVIFNQDGLHVAVVENGRVHIRPITIARDFGTTVEVRSGVRDGDRVINNPPVDLVDGSKVNVQAEGESVADEH
jgi:RND family efflux transporter MFP subunit